MKQALLIVVMATCLATPALAVDGGWTLVGWNDLGMPCMDADYRVFAILPPYNTVHAQLIDPDGMLVTTPAGITVTYEAVADPSGSINTSSAGKTGFWDHVLELFGVDLAPDQGLAGFTMPGPGNIPQAMVFDEGLDWFTAEGIPITPYDDGGSKSYYPMMRLIARDSNGAVLASTDVVLPVSDEMDCSACHSSGAGEAARPGNGWEWSPDSELDYRLNILQLHDEMRSGSAAYAGLLTTVGYDPDGLYATAKASITVLCATCHASNALPGTGVAGLPFLTQAIHSRHALVLDPTNGLALDSSDNRTSCYRCHPGSETSCLRGAMGAAVAADGVLEMECQSCHGSLSLVGSSDRQGWFEEPTCQSCHTGTATQNNGQIRYTSVFASPGNQRQAASQRFATQPDTPMPGLSLYRFSRGHGSLQCEACHGSTHAIYPTEHGNDNLQSQRLQGHAGTLSECSTCHNASPSTTTGGPHGMHPVGQPWVNDHEDAAEHHLDQCQSCHGTDARGTVLSRALGPRALSTSFGQKTFWQGFQVSCYACHNGPDSSSRSTNAAPVVVDAALRTTVGVPGTISLVVTDADNDPVTLRIVSQPKTGLAALAGAQLTYYPTASFSGGDELTVAAWDGKVNSNLGTVHVTVGAADTSIFSDDFESGSLSFWSKGAL